MKTEHSAGFVIFRIENGVRTYLLLYKKAERIYKESWGFPKGWPEKNESDLAAARRETAEEAGITEIIQIVGFKEESEYSFRRKLSKAQLRLAPKELRNSKGELVSKTITWFLGETEQKAVKISWEHAGFEWLPYKEAMERLTYKPDKIILEKAEKLKQKIKF